MINQVLEKTDLTVNEVNKYTYWDPEKAYTRNLVIKDSLGCFYSVLLRKFHSKLFFAVIYIYFSQYAGIQDTNLKYTIILAMGALLKR